ncbi:MAG: hypothetical protein WA210_18110, partial [Burkholderiaceae bacterium]
WLQAEEAIRVPLIEPWRVRLADPAFRAAVLAHLARHPEWQPLVVPPRKPRPRIVVPDNAPTAPPLPAATPRPAEKVSAPA